MAERETEKAKQGVVDEKTKELDSQRKSATLPLSAFLAIALIVFR